MRKQTLGAMISSKRKEAGMTQLDLANKMGVTDKAVSKWERDLSFPDVGSIPKLAEVLDVSVDELMQTKMDSIPKNNYNIGYILDIILSAVPLAMGIVVVVLSVLKQIDAKDGLPLLGIGMACIGIQLLKNDREA